MAWDWRKLAALAVCSAAYASVLSCQGAEFSAGDGGDSGSGGAGGQVSGAAGKQGDPGGSDAGGKSGGSGGTPNPMGGATNAGTGGDVDPGGAGEPTGTGGQPPVMPPISKDGLLYWFAADAGVTQEQGVAKWANQANSAHNAIQLLPDLQPTLSQSAGAPHPFLEFDGQDDYLELPELNIDWSAGLSLFVVAGSMTHEGCSGYIELSQGPEINDLHFGIHNHKLQYELVDETLTAPEGAVPLGELSLTEVHHGGAPDMAPVELRINGAQAGSRVLPLPAEVLRVSNFLGRTLYASCQHFSGAMGELILYSRRVTADERGEIEQYLMSKWQCCN
jgi:hypothetical protein